MEDEGVRQSDGIRGRETQGGKKRQSERAGERTRQVES